MNRRDVVLAILGSEDGRAFSPVQLQKAAFLVDQNAPSVFDDHRFGFRPYDYGPYDKAVYDEASALSLMGLVKVETPVGSRYRQYLASPEGIERAKALLASLPPNDANYIREVAKWVRSLSFAGLVKSIYQAYPDMRQNSVFSG